jgi:AcrR family transcriptional regulator
MTETPKPPKKRRGRPKRTQAEIEDMRSEIKRCAKLLFQKEGYPAVSMRRLAQEAGITVMTLYKYFERKIDILRALWQTIFEELFTELEAGASHIEDARRASEVSRERIRQLLAGPSRALFHGVHVERD